MEFQVTAKNKHQRKEPTTTADLSRRKEFSVIVGNTENNSSVTGAAGTGGGNHRWRALLQIHGAKQLLGAPTSQKLLAAQLEEDMDGAEVVDGFGWALLKGDLWF